MLISTLSLGLLWVIQKSSYMEGLRQVIYLCFHIGKKLSSSAAETHDRDARASIALFQGDEHQ